MHKIALSEAEVSRFMEKISPEPNSGCWLWTASVNSDRGYGLFFVKRGEKVVKLFAHRISMKVFKNEEPDENLVCHKCDNPFCVNPDHLFLGTHQDNMDDAWRKGRMDNRRALAGEDNPKSLLSNAQVLEIRTSNLPTAELAIRYGVAKALVRRVRCGRSYPSVGGRLVKKPSPRKYTEDEKRLMLDRSRSPKFIAAQIGSTPEKVKSFRKDQNRRRTP